MDMEQKALSALAAVLAAVCILLGFGLMKAGEDRQALRAQLAECKAKHEKAVADATRAALASDQKYRALEQQMAEKVKEKDDALAQARLDVAARTRSDGAVIDGLRAQLRAWAAAPAAGATPEAAAAELRERAAAAGDLLEDGMRVQDALAAAAETHAAEVRNLLGRQDAVTCGGG